MNAASRELGEAARRRQLFKLLLSSALGLSEADTEAGMHSLEGSLSAAAPDRVCTFLGHPPVCLDGRPIPPGRCCQTLAAGPLGVVQPVTPLTEMKSGDLCEVVLIRPRHHARLDRLTTYGIVPGVTVRIHQTRPAFVVQVGQTDLSLDGEVAADIFVRRSDVRS